MDSALKAALKKAIDGNVHLHSARINKDYLTIGIEIAPQFPEQTKTVNMQNINGDKFHAVMVPIPLVREAMA